MRCRIAVLVLVVAISFLPRQANAQWQVDGVAISTATGQQYIPQIVSDGAGGAIIAWRDWRGTAADIYAQRVDALGIPQWTADGVALCTAAGRQDDPAIVPDGIGGAIVTWEDNRTGTADIYAQRVNALGVPQWTADGVALCTAAGDQSPVKIVSDGTSGAIVAWHDFRTGTADIYAQRVDLNGVPKWTVDGAALCTAGHAQIFPAIVSDGAGGAIAAWTDVRSGTYADIYAQRVSALGIPQWTANGVAVCGSAGDQGVSAIVSDGASGAIVTWEDHRPGDGIYAQRVDALGVPQWTTDGVALCTAAFEQYNPKIASDDAGGAIVTWEDNRTGNTNQIYAQRVSVQGVPLWTANGVAVSESTSKLPTIVSDGAAGAIVTWTDSGSTVSYSDIYAQRVSALGVPQWTANGVALCTAADEQSDPTIVSDGAGGAIVTWWDYRSGDSDIYAQHVTGPLNAVAIASFDASQTNGVVMLRSTFRSDLGVEAVNVYRAVGTDDNQLMMIERVDDVPGDRFEYVDRDVAPGQSYRYRIGVVDGDGEFFSPIVTVSVKAITASLAQNQPNPFNPTTTIHFVLPVREHATLSIYDTSGRLVRTLVNEVQGYGAHDVTWDGRNDDGVAMGSGVYFYRLRAGKTTEAKKMVLLK